MEKAMEKEMNNTQLRPAIKVYREIKKELDELKNDYLMAQYKLQVLIAAGEAIDEKLKKQPLIYQRVLEDIYLPERKKAFDKESQMSFKLDHDDAQKHTYLELKFDAIKKILGEKIIAKLEEYEREEILKGIEALQ